MKRAHFVYYSNFSEFGMKINHLYEKINNIKVLVSRYNLAKEPVDLKYPQDFWATIILIGPGMENRKKCELMKKIHLMNIVFKKRELHELTK